MAVAYLNGKRRQLSPSMVIGKGGEADIYDLSDGTVLKLYKQPDDPDFTGNPALQQAARSRLNEQQLKLKAFPGGLPDRIVRPIDLATDKTQRQIVGFTMCYLSGMEVLLSYGDRNFREKGGIDANSVVSIFGDLHGLVTQVHRARVVIGDFNDLNVLVDTNGHVYLVDADSMQFGQFYCQTFTVRFLDPLLCPPGVMTLSSPHSVESDWYAFNTMLFQSLLYTGPYGGVHRPKNGKRLQHGARVFSRFTVFDPEVLYPKPALPYDRLPDDLLEYFRRVYKEDLREAFPENLIKSLRWTTCKNCKAVHARAKCPECAAPGVVRQTVVKRGPVTATRVFRTSGRILRATYQGDKLRYLFYENGSFRREGDQKIVDGKLDTELRFRINSNNTLLGKRERLLFFAPGQQPVVHKTDTMAGHLPMFDTNAHSYFWLQDGQLVRNGRLGSDYIGDVLPNRTMFWAGDKFGFGFYQAGQLVRAFVFKTDGRGLNDQVPIPALPGQLIDATCVFSESYAWFMVSLQTEGRIENRCYVVDSRGNLIAQAEAAGAEESWLSGNIRGRCASGKSLLAATDEGIVLITADNGTINVNQKLPDTEPFVNGNTQLLAGDGGIYAVSSREITHLKFL